MPKQMTDDVYCAVDTERSYQKALWGEPPHEVGSFLVFVRTYLRKAEDALTVDDEPLTLENVRKCAALLVACMEQHGAPRRTGY